MPIEYQSLSIVTFFFLLAWVPSSFGKWQSFGFRWLASNRAPVTDKALVAWAARCERAHNNLKDNLPAFIVAILILGQTGKFDQGTALASMLYVAARLGHFASYGAGFVLGRAIFFFLGIFVNIYLFIKIFI